MPIARIRLAALVVSAAAAVAAVFASIGGAASQATAPSPTGAPTISGSLQQGQTLSTTSGSWSGSTPMNYTYQWQRCNTSGNSCSFISGATSSLYTLASDDVGHSMRSVVTAHNSAGTHAATSNHTGTVKAAAAPSNTQLPSISGTASVGATLTASNGSWNGAQTITYTYQWSRCDTNGNNCSNIGSATKSEYTLTNGDEGRRLRVRVTAKNGVGQATALSNATDVVTSGAPAASVAPTVSGTPTQGEGLKVNNGTWVGAQPISFTYTWARCDSGGNNCATIPGTTDPTYLVTAPDVGHTIRANVTGKNSVGSTTAQTAAVGPVKASTTAPPPTTTTVIPASSVDDNDRLTISSVKYRPGPFHGRGPITATIKVIDENNHPVSGALVYVLPTPLNFANHPAEVPTGATGTATVQLTLTSKAPKSGGLILFIRARTPQGNLLSGSSSRRLVQIRIFAK